MHVERHGWYTHRLGREMSLTVHGHYGLPILVFPTASGNEREWEDRGLVGALAHHLDGGRVKLYCVGCVNQDVFQDTAQHPGHRTWLLEQYDGYVTHEVVPFVHDHCRTPGIAIATAGASLGAFHAVNVLLKHPDVFRRCLALSGVYDMRSAFAGYYDDNLYFNNPVDYAASLTDPYYLGHLGGCDIHLSTGHGPWEDSAPTYRLSEVLSARGIPHFVDNWGAEGGHDWPFWRNQMDLYVGRLF